MNKIPVIAVVGPTASGKTALAVRLAKALNGEVISADSMQIYKGPAIATAQPTEEEKDGVVHRMIGFLPVTEKYSAAAYVNDANREIDEVLALGKIPVICGGTGLYIDSLLGDMVFSPCKENAEIRQRLFERCESEGAQALLDELYSLDPEYAATLHPNNKIRIIRALEIYEMTGQIPSLVRKSSLGNESRFDPLYIGLDYKNREILYDRINRRVDIMMKNGLLEEAEKYAFSSGATAVQAIGHKELIPYLEGKCTLEEAVESLKRATRRYAKRQLTWFRRNSEIRYFYPDEAGFENAVLSATELAQNFIRKESQ